MLPIPPALQAQFEEHFAKARCIFRRLWKEKGIRISGQRF